MVDDTRLRFALDPLDISIELDREGESWSGLSLHFADYRRAVCVWSLLAQHDQGLFPRCDPSVSGTITICYFTYKKQISLKIWAAHLSIFEQWIKRT